MSKTIHDLTIRDNFMFAAVMQEDDNCKELLEMILGVEIEKIEINTEHSFVYHPDFHGIRMDVFTKDNHGTHYNIEMQVAKDDIPKRTRYYHSHMDMDMLLKGTDYEVLPNSYVIFICDFDPIGSRKYQYTIHHQIEEAPDAVFDDGSYTILLSTKGENAEDVSPALVEFLRFVAKDTKSQTLETSSVYVKKLQNSIQKIKADRTRGEQFMLLEEMLKKSKKEGKAEGRAEGMAEGKAEGLKLSLSMILQKFDKPVPASIANLLEESNDVEFLADIVKKAVEFKTLDDLVEYVTKNH